MSIIVGRMDPAVLKSRIQSEGSSSQGQSPRGSHFVALMPFRWGPRSGMREFLIVPYAEDYGWFNTREGVDETECHLARLKTERLGFIPKFIGGTNKDCLNETVLETIIREFFQEAGILIDSKQLCEEVLLTHEEVVKGWVIPGTNPEQRTPDHHKYFKLFDAERCWPLWKDCCRREIKIEMPYIVPEGGPQRQRAPEILGIPTWVTVEELLGIIHHSHTKALLAAMDYYLKSY